MPIQDPLPPTLPTVAQTDAGSFRQVLHPVLSPDGQRLVFIAAGRLWQQSLNGGQAQRLFEGRVHESWPAFSPNGRQLAFVHRDDGREEVRVFDYARSQISTLDAGLQYEQLSWSPDGQRLSWVEENADTASIVVFSRTERTKKQVRSRGMWSPRPHFSSDGQSLYVTANRAGRGTLSRLSLQKKDTSHMLTQLSRPISDGLVSPDGKWLAFRRNWGVWLASTATQPITEDQVHMLSAEGGKNFTFAPDSSAAIYATRNRVWRQPLAGGDREEITIRFVQPPPTPSPILLRNVRLLNFETQGFGPPTDVFLENGDIQWIGADRGQPLPAETIILDGQGRFAIPGLFDLHVHANNTDPRTFLAYGITSVRDTGSWIMEMDALNDRADFSAEPAPRSFFSGAIFEGQPPFWGDYFLPIATATEARDAVRRQKKAGAHFIKVYSSLSWPLQRVVAQEARQNGLPVVGHGMDVEGVTKSVMLGYASLEHTSFFHRFYEDVLQMLAAAGTHWDPTLAVVGGNALLLRDEPTRLADTKLRAWTSERQLDRARRHSHRKAVGDYALRGYWQETLASVRAAHALGVQLLVGTDTPNPECFVGASLHWELGHFVQAGLSPFRVLQLATQKAAAFLGAAELGTLAVGKRADLVLLDANPLEDIRNTQTIWRVIKAGGLFDPNALRPVFPRHTP